MRTHGRSLARTAAASLRWLLAGTLVATAHGAAVWLAVEWQPHEAAASEPPPAMMIELAPLAVTPDIVPIQSVASADSAPEEPQEAPDKVEPQKPPEPLPPPEPVTPPEPVKPPDPPKPVEPAPPKPQEPTPPPPVEPPVKSPEPAVPDPLPAEPKPAPQEEPRPPEPPKVEPAKAPVTPPAPPKPEPPKVETPKAETPKAETPRTDPVVRKAESAKPKKPSERKVAAKPKSSAAPRSANAVGAKAAKSAAPVSGAGQASVSPASWKSRLLTHLNRHKRFPRGAGAGTASVAFSIDRLGRVLSARLANSSGDARLDDEAVSLVRRASPVPVPPEGFGGGRIALTVPVRFSR